MIQLAQIIDRDIIFESLTAIGGLALILSLMLSARQDNSNKALTVAVLVLFLFADVLITERFSIAGDGIFIYRIMFDFLLVIALHLKPCRETAIIMMLSLCSVLINIFGFSYSLLSPFAASGIVIDSALMAVFYTMLAVLWHKGLANGIYRFINHFSAVRGYCADYLKIDTKRIAK